MKRKKKKRKLNFETATVTVGGKRIKIKAKRIVNWDNKCQLTSYFVRKKDISQNMKQALGIDTNLKRNFIDLNLQQMYP